MNIRQILRYLFFFFLAMIICAMERTVGLPFFYFLITLVYIESFEKYGKVLAWIFFSLILASFYTISFALAFLLLFLLMFVYEMQWTLWNRESVKVFFALLVSGIVLAFATHLRFDIFAILYHLVALIGVFLGIRFWFRKRHGGTKLSVANRLTN
jgi:hypothetical protein